MGDMDKFASPEDFLAELRRLTDYCQDGKPSRIHVAKTLLEMAVRVAAEDVEAFEHPSQKALETYLRKHPKADPKKHTVRDPSKKKEPKAPAAEPKKDEPRKEFDNTQPKELPPALRGPVNQYDHEDVRDLARSFRNLDNRKTRLEGLMNSKRLIDHYYRGPQAREMHEAIDKMIEDEKRNPTPLGIEHHRYVPPSKK